MTAIENHQLYVGTSIISHSFNQNRSEVAVVPNSNEVNIYSRQGSGWKLSSTLTDHDKLVTCVDWAPTTNRIVTCSQDRNAYVWNWNTQTQTWTPTLVLLRISRAATHVRWSPKEDKFAVASGARLISICYYEDDHKENDWWVSKHLKKPIRSTVLSVDWHPDNILLAAGSSDMKARVFSAYIKGVDAKASNPVWGEKLPFGTVCGELSAGGWVHSVSFSPTGNQLAYCSHDSTVTIASGPTQLQVISTPYLPCMSIFWGSEASIVAAGHDCIPFLFSFKNGKWELDGKIEQKKKKEALGNSAFDKFKQMDARAQVGGDAGLNSIHQNTITCVRAFAGTADRVSQFSTTGLDGQLVIWDLLAAGVSNLRM